MSCEPAPAKRVANAPRSGQKTRRAVAQCLGRNSLGRATTPSKRATGVWRYRAVLGLAAARPSWERRRPRRPGFTPLRGRLALSRRPWSLVRPRTVAKPPDAPQAQTKDQGQWQSHQTKDFPPSPLLRHGLQGRRRGKRGQESGVRSQESGVRHQAQRTKHGASQAQSTNHQARRKAPTRKFPVTVNFHSFPLPKFSLSPISNLTIVIHESQLTRVTRKGSRSRRWPVWTGKHAPRADMLRSLPTINRPKYRRSRCQGLKNEPSAATILR